MDCGLPSSSSSKSSLVRSRTILPFLSRTVTGKLTTLTSTERVVVGVPGAGLWEAGEGAAGAGGPGVWDSSAGARKNRQSSGEKRREPMPTLDDRKRHPVQLSSA